MDCEHARIIEMRIGQTWECTHGYSHHIVAIVSSDPSPIKTTSPQVGAFAWDLNGYVFGGPKDIANRLVRMTSAPPAQADAAMARGEMES